MKKAVIISIILMLLGAVILAGAYAYSGFDISKFGTDVFATKTYIEDGDFTKIGINALDSDVELKKSADGKVTVECSESVKIRRDIVIENGVLCVRGEDGRTWLDRIGISVKAPKMTVYLPEGKYESMTVGGSTGDISVPDGFSFGRIQIVTDTGDVKIESAPSIEEGLTYSYVEITTDTGDVAINGIVAGDIEIQTSTGDVAVNSVSCTGRFRQTVSTGDTAIETLTCKSFESNGSTGEITLNNAFVSGSLSIKRSTGDVTLNNSDADEINIVTDTGDVTGVLLSGKEFITETNTGDVVVPRGGTGGKCIIATDTGDIVFTPANG
ncbi:MAG: DUF4097 family beta strand repeat protein [Clostridia bacterium]|nr:DUF4097 family beta strand repeat protein [Clostridia bacterium]